MTPPVRNVVILTGSGISAESGVATFRDKDGVWSRYDYRDVATPEGFARDPELVHEFYNARRRGLGSVLPNAAHTALAELERALEKRGGALTLITQNVDDLHERAGSNNILHMHGELAKVTCAACGDIRSWQSDLNTGTPCPSCNESGAMRPYVVWFGEMPHFLSIGTSGSVYPAAGFVGEARQAGVPAIELNLEPSENAYLFTDARYGPATKIVPEWVAEISG